MKKIAQIKTKNKNYTSIFEKRPTGKSTYEAFREVSAWREIPLPAAQVDRLEKAILDWCDEEDSVSFDEFLDERGIGDDVWIEWRDKHPKIQKAYEYAMRHIGVKREKGMAIRKYDTNAYSRNQHHFSKTWRLTRDEDYQRKVAITQTAASAPTLIKVISEAIPNCPEVPDYRKPIIVTVPNIAQKDDNEEL